MNMCVVNSIDELWGWLKQIVPTIDFTGKHIVVIKRYYQKRTLKMNNFYWLWVTAIAHEIGEDKNTVHEALKRKFLKWEKKELPGELDYYSPGHTSDCDTKEFNEYLNQIHLWAYSFLNMHLPYPDEASFGFFFETYSSIKQVNDI